MIRYAKWTVREVETGIFLTGVIGTLILSIVVGFTSPETLGFILGIIGAGVLFYSMGVSLETSLDMGDAEAARKHSVKMYGIRYAVIILLVLVLSRFDQISVVTALLALFSIKIGVYLQPWTHKLFCRWFHLKDEVSPDALTLPDDEEDEEDEDDSDDIGRKFEQWMGRKYGK